MPGGPADPGGRQALLAARARTVLITRRRLMATEEAALTDASAEAAERIPEFRVSTAACA